MPSNVNAKPIGLMSPWFSDLKKATADGRVTKTEVKKLIETHKDMFGDKTYRASLQSLLDNSGKAPVRLTDGAKAELKTALEGPHIWFPTHDQLKKTYATLCDAAIKNGTAKQLKHAPAGYQDAPSYNITPPGMVDNSRVIYDVKGELYMAHTGFAGITTWMDCGPAPLF